MVKLNVEINQWVIEGVDGKKKRQKKKKGTFSEKGIKLISGIN